MPHLAAHIAGTGMHSNQVKVQTISNNLANMNTHAFKAASTSTDDLTYITYGMAGSITSGSGTMLPSSMQIGLGSKVAAIVKDFTQGSSTLTDNQWNATIQGEGFVAVALADGSTGYTRNLEFGRSSNGDLTDKMGNLITPGINIPANAQSITITPDGTITGSDGLVTFQIGQLQLNRFVNPAGLNAIGNNLYVQTDSSGAAITGTPNTVGFGSIQQYSLEDSNVNSIKEIVGLLDAQRGYEYCAKCLQTADQMSKTEVEVI